jgi:hypothetical protein
MGETAAMKLNEWWRRRGIYLLLSLLLLVIGVVAVARKISQEGERERSEERPQPGEWVYVSLEKKDPLFPCYAGRPGRLVSTESLGAKVEYQLSETAEPEAVMVPPRTIRRCPPEQEGVDGDFAGTMRIWNGSEATPLEAQTLQRAEVGDNVTVEVKNFDHWIFTQFDFGRLKGDLNNLPVSIEKLVKEAVEARRAVILLRGVTKVNQALRVTLREGASTCKGTSKEEAWRELIGLINGDSVLKRIKDKMEEPLVGEGFTPENVDKLERQFLPIKVWAQAVTERRFKQLTLTINGVALAGILPQNDYNEAEVTREKRPSFPFETYQWARFVLERIEVNPKATDRENEVARANEIAWSKLVGRPALSLPSTVTLRLLEEGLEMPTKITVHAKDPECRFYLIGIKAWIFWVTIAVFLCILAFLFWLAKTTDILRDSSGRVRPDGLQPVSLGRTQMAFWFILTVGAYIFLWVTTGNHNAINETCLILLGIGSGTALGAAFIESASTRFLVTSPLNRPRGQISAAIANAILVRLQKLSFLVSDQDTQTQNEFIAVLDKLKEEETKQNSGVSERLEALSNKLKKEWKLEVESTELENRQDVDEMIIALARKLKSAPKAGSTKPGAHPEEEGSYEVLASELELLGVQQAGFKKMPRTALQRVFTDWLGEGSNDKWSFHRFQMLAWTLVFGFVFVIKVLKDRAMPEFDLMALALLGISAGTYLGFKLPGAKKDEVPKNG